MRIGLDIDNVISDFDKKMLEEFLREDKNKRNKGIVNPNGNWIKDFFDWSNDEINVFLNESVETFAKDLDIRENSKYFIDKLLRKGHKIYLISNRTAPHYKQPYETTTEWLEKKHINYSKLILSKESDKTKECKENNIDVMFDDNRKNCRQLLQNNVDCYLMATKYNKRKNIEGLKIVEDWKGLYEVIKNMEKKKIILDTDMFNEIDDQFALVYLMKSLNMFDLKAITIAPFLKSGYSPAKTIEEGTEKSYETTLHILDLLEKSEYKNIVFKGATKYMKDSAEDNAATSKIIEIAKDNEKTTILAIGAITNVALAIKKAPEIISKIKVVWLGGNSFLTNNNDEFNFRQDIKAVQTVFDSGVELVVIPCRNVASHLSTTIYELEHYLQEDSELNRYLCDIFRKCKKPFIKEPKDEIGMSKTLWDLSAIAYEINADWFKCEYISCPKILEDGKYELTENKHKVIFVNDLFRNKIYRDFFIKINQQ